MQRERERETTKFGPVISKGRNEMEKYCSTRPLLQAGTADRRRAVSSPSSSTLIKDAKITAQLHGEGRGDGENRGEKQLER